MTKHFPYSIAFSAAVAVLATGANAATVSSVSVVDTTNFGSVTTSDTAVDGTASVDLPFLGSFAIQNADGTSEVQAGVIGFGPESKVTASASFEQSETNADNFDRDYTLTYELSGQSADFFFGFGETDGPLPPIVVDDMQPPVQVFSFSSNQASTPVVTASSSAAARTSGIAPTNSDNPFTEVDDPAALTADFTPFSAASFEYIISVNGEEVLNARADALLNGFSPSSGLVFDAVSGFTPSQSGNATDGFTFSVAPISGTIELGTFGAGESLNITSTLIARSYTPGGFPDGFPISVNTFTTDPVKLFSIGSAPTNPANPNPAAVPLPAAGWMLIAALGGLGVAARRKKA